MTDQNIDLLEVQRGLEDESRAIGRARYRNKRGGDWVDLFGPEVDEGALPPGRAMIRRAVKPTAEAIAGFLAQAETRRAGRRHGALDLLEGLGPDPLALAYLTLRCGLQAAAQNHRAQKAATMVARAVKDHLEATRFEQLNPKGAAGLQKHLNGRRLVSAKRQRAMADIREAEGASLVWDAKQELSLGLKLIELAVEATGLFELELVSTRQGKTMRREQQLHVTDRALEWLERQHERCELLDPLPLPMVVPPRPWTTPHDGGYLQPLLGARLVRSRSRPYLEELANADMPQVYQAVNAAQATRWRINRQLLSLIEQVVEAGEALGGLPRQDLEMPSEYPAEAVEDSEVVRTWKRAAAEVHRRNAQTRSARLELAQRLWVARKLADYPAIYFPHECDWRGRLYPVPMGGPHPQAGDVGRALLEFAEGKPLGPSGARWLAIHLANVFGVDKVSFDERVAWTKQNSARIIDSAQNPLDGGRFWTTADKPWIALAACLEWAGYQAEGEGFISRQPIAVDGSNSGLQHLTALLRDTEAAPHVNLLAAERPGDIYAVVASRAQALVDASSDSKAKPWQGGKITRALVKRPCMTFAYSVTAHGMIDQIMTELEALDSAAAEAGNPLHLAGADNFAAAAWLAKQLYRLIGEAVPKARQAMDWFKRAAKAVDATGLPIWWTSPSGLPVMQRYAGITSTKLETTFRSNRIQLQLDDETGPSALADWLDQGGTSKTQSSKVANSIAPNFVHSLDAAHLMLTVNAAQAAGIADLALIHDSFGTHAADTDRLSAILRETFIAMYQANPLARFRAELVRQLEHDPAAAASIPELPEHGNLDLTGVVNATYMFA